MLFKSDIILGNNGLSKSFTWYVASKFPGLNWAWKQGFILFKLYPNDLKYIHVTSQSWLLRALSEAVARQLWWAYTLWGTGRARRGALTAAQWPSILPEVSGYHKGGMTWRKPLSLTLRGFKLQRTYFTGSIFHLIAFYELTLTEDNSSNFCVSHPNTELVMLSEFNASLGNKKIGLTIG